MKKLFLIFFLLLLVSIPILANADSLTPLVQCGDRMLPNGTIANPCKITDFFQMLVRIYKFMVYIIALPLAGILIVIGGILMIISGGNPGRFEQGRNMVKITIIALCIILGSWLIINSVFMAIGYTGNWSSF